MKRPDSPEVTVPSPPPYLSSSSSDEDEIDPLEQREKNISDLRAQFETFCKEKGYEISRFPLLASEFGTRPAPRKPKSQRVKTKQSGGDPTRRSERINAAPRLFLLEEVTSYQK